MMPIDGLAFVFSAFVLALGGGSFLNVVGKEKRRREQTLIEMKRLEEEGPQARVVRVPRSNARLPARRAVSAPGSTGARRSSPRSSKTSPSGRLRARAA